MTYFLLRIRKDLAIIGYLQHFFLLKLHTFMYENHEVKEQI